MRVLVTGGAGFVGSHTVDLLLSEGFDVVVLDNLDPQIHNAEDGYPVHLRRHKESGRFAFIKGDVRDTDLLGRAVRGADAVLHLAAAVGVGQSMYEPLYYADANVTGSAALLQAVLRVRSQIKRIVVASSMSIYGEGAYECPRCPTPGVTPLEHPRGDGLWDLLCPACGAPLRSVPTNEGKPLAPTSIYAITKRVQEEMALCFGRAYHLPTIALRYFNIYGSRQAMHNPYTGVMAIFLSRLLNDKPPLVFEDGLQSRDFIHVFDIARANVRALTSSDAGCAVLNVGTGRSTSVLTLAGLLARELDLAIEPQILSRSRAGDVRHCYADISAIRRELGWEPQMTLRDGIGDLIAWARDQRPPDRVEQAVRELTQQGLVR
jgi:dTDP-L-rhamnose 4-epimerase